LEKLQAALADAEGRMETLRLEILSLQDSREGERKSRLAGEQRIRELEEQLSARPGLSGENTVESRQALDEAQTQLDDLRSQFRHLEGNHEEQTHKAEQRVKELTAVLEREKNELHAARMEIDRLKGETEMLQKVEGFEEELFQARLRVEELETRLCSEAEIRSRAERNAIESQSRLDEVSKEAGQKVRQALAERDEALGLAQKAQTLREQEATRFQERERLSAQRVAALRRVESPASTRVPTRALSALPVPWPLFLVVIVIVCGGGFLLGRWQGGAHPLPVADQTSSSSISPSTIPGAVSRPPAPKPVQWPSIKGKFIRVQTTADRMTMVFEYAVFSRRTEIQPDALRDLQKLARQLAPLTPNFRIEITGHTDADQVSAKVGEYANNQDLGLKRSQAVREALIRQGGLPPESMTAVSAGELNPPYPNTTPESRKKNRTVTIALIPK
jgi:flagellar motor protein MotB